MPPDEIRRFDGILGNSQVKLMAASGVTLLPSVIRKRKLDPVEETSSAGMRIVRTVLEFYNNLWRLGIE
jgi:hypothetical protein